ncbi:MAG: nucleotidyl transferase AbiEii/AbiGii toxin family protein [Candidatus Kerfeldbacteria bacterium]|nr:nucleotidyl transferase AbiEii/AbiGii toxin family protein [Candidatus Kerfeldbacteria bacterium]
MNPSILTGDQKALLDQISLSLPLVKRFYLTGGTALAEFYLHHRYSEDLDFFSEQEVDPEEVLVVLSGMKEKLGIQDIDAQQSFNRNLFFLKFPDGVVKTEFTYFPFPQIEQATTQQGLRIDSILDIAVNKLFTIYQRTKARDYIDLYCICQDYGFTISDLRKKMRIKFDVHIDPLQLGAQFVKAFDAPDLPRMIRKLDPQEWQTFFVREAKQLKSEVME